MVDQAASVPKEQFFQEHIHLLLMVAVLFLLVRPLLMSVQAAMNSLSLQLGLFHLVLWRLNRYTLGQSLNFFIDDFAGRLAQKQSQTASAVGNVGIETLNAITVALALALGAVIVLGQADSILALVLVLWIGLYIGVLKIMLPRVRKFARESAGANAALTGQLVDTFSNIATVKLFAHSERELAAAEEHFGYWRTDVLRLGATSLKLRVSLSLLAGLLPTSLIGTALWLCNNDQAATGVVVVAALLSARLAAMSGWFSFMLMGLYSNLGNSEDGNTTLAVPYELEDAPNALVRGIRGSEAHLGERGVKLSVGQRQRIALARVLLKDAPTLLLDEATSAMDSEVEAAIQSTLESAVEGKAVIAIAHRLSTIARMDRIVVIQEGRVVELGRYEQLLLADGLYSRL